ncbi:hypothetical protein SEPCBS119000_004541 [Sporothrix epigloea]|uniref:Uncharacterized protein n=1 Tax=Sporothrix epigloea TaxID=1892477 RepID=A0ABP0DSM9_9PEZI
MRRRRSPDIEDQVSNETDTSTADNMPQNSSKPDFHYVCNLLDQIFTQKAEEFKSIREYSEVFEDRRYEIKHMSLGWEIPEGLAQIVYLNNLGPEYGQYVSSIYREFTIGGIGHGRAISLYYLISCTIDEAERLAAAAKRLAARADAIVNTSTVAYLARANRSRKRRPSRIPSNYRGPHRKVCSIHGWVDGPSNHDNTSCLRQQATK